MPPRGRCECAAHGLDRKQYPAAKKALGELAGRTVFLQGQQRRPGPSDRLRAAMQYWGRLDGILISVGGPPAGKALPPFYFFFLQTNKTEPAH